MSPFEWMTLLVALVVGFGGAMVAGRIQRKQAEAQRIHETEQRQREDREKRRNALIDYERALREAVLSIEGRETGMSNMPYPTNLVELRRAAYPYFYSLRESESEEEQAIYWRLLDPGAGEIHEPQHAIDSFQRSYDAAVELIRRLDEEDKALSS